MNNLTIEIDETQADQIALRVLNEYRSYVQTDILMFKKINHTKEDLNDSFELLKAFNKVINYMTPVE